MGKLDEHNANEAYLAQWLEGTLSDDELKELVSASDFDTFMKLREGLQVYESLEQPVDASFADLQKRIEDRRKTKVRRLYIGWAASVAAVAILFFGLFTILGKGATLVETSFAEQTSFSLPDDSEVVLNAKSRIDYRKSSWDENRSVQLDGEAFFKVEKGSAFSVSTPNGVVQVLGTQFNVNSNSDFFEVTCFEGRVRVTYQGNETVLEAGDAFRKINGFADENWEVATAAPSWIRGESSFRSVPLAYVITELEEQYNLKFDSQAINTELIFTGSFGHDDVDVALASVFKTMQVHYEQEEGGVILLRPYE